MILTLPLSRYRAVWAIHLIPFAGLALSRAWAGMREPNPRSVLRLSLGVAVVAALQLLVQRDVLFRDRGAMASMYRPSEFVLSARMDAESGRFAAAAREMEQLAVLHPDPGIRAQALALAREYRGRVRGPS